MREEFDSSKYSYSRAISGKCTQKTPREKSDVDLHDVPPFLCSLDVASRATTLVCFAVLVGRDIIGLAETGSGKTASFALPILQALLDKPQPFYGLVLAPTRCASPISK